jgi:hypothetical protein
MSAVLRKLAQGLLVLVGVALVALLGSIVTDFSTWPWHTRRTYADGELELHIGATKLDVWNRILEMESEGKLVPQAGTNNDSRASTTEFKQVHDLDWWSFPIPPCCRCSLDLTFVGGKLMQFERYCNYAPEGT